MRLPPGIQMPSSMPNYADMRDEYDFSQSERGRFYRKDAVLSPPVHLDAYVLTFLTARAAARGLSAGQARQCASEEAHRADRGGRRPISTVTVSRGLQARRRGPAGANPAGN